MRMIKCNVEDMRYIKEYIKKQKQEYLTGMTLLSGRITLQ
nr:MAG TPA: hypothetical protein [Bacteriophage sp.]